MGIKTMGFICMGLMLWVALSTVCCNGGGGGESGSSGDSDSDSDTDTDTDTGSSNLVDIASYGTTDLEYDGEPLVNPAQGLPPLSGVDPTYTPGLSSQALPDSSTSILELEKVSSYVGMSFADLEVALRSHGIARSQVLPSMDLMAQSIDNVAQNMDEPAVLLTSDALFNTFHNFFDNLLLGVEVRTLIPRVSALVEALKISAAQRYNSLQGGATKEATLDVVAYLQTAHTLLDPSAPMIAQVNQDVTAEIALLTAHEGFAASAIFDRPEYSEDPCVDCDPCDADPSPKGCNYYVGGRLKVCEERYCEDYSQYVPRGHYTYNEDLERYFKAVMWLGRMSFLNRSDQSSRGAVVMVDSLKSTVVDMDGEDISAEEIWRQFFRVIGTFAGSMDDLNASEIDGAIVEAMGSAFSLQDLDDGAKVVAIQSKVSDLRDPEILSGFMSALADMGEETKGLRLMGQVYIPDSYALGQLVYGNVGADDERPGWNEATANCGVDSSKAAEALTSTEQSCVCGIAWYFGYMELCRGLPSGLDVASVLGSSAARTEAVSLWSGYAGYEDKMDDLIGEFQGFTLGDWGKSLSWTWLYAISGLLEDVDSTMPAFMQTPAWTDKTLETSLASWAEMRHDTILYAKQSYTAGDADSDCDTDTGAEDYYDFDYVEPQPKAYSRLAAAGRRLETLAQDEGLFGGESAALGVQLGHLVDLFEEATVISIKELEGDELDLSDTMWIRGSGSRISSLENSLLNSLDLLASDEEPDPDRLKTTLIADVHTFPAKETVLEVGSGYLEYVAVVHRLPGGQWGVAVGPAFSYHEFEQPMNDRLTDEDWRHILAQDPDHGHPAWLE